MKEPVILSLHSCRRKKISLHLFGLFFLFPLFIMFLAVLGQDDDWIDPYDMLNYDASTKTMRNTPDSNNYDNVPTKRREYIQEGEDSVQVELGVCTNKVETLQREIEDHKRRVEHISQQPTCNPVFKRFLSRLLKELDRVGQPGNLKQEVLYDAKVKVSPQAVMEIQKLLQGSESWRTGALDDAVSQILVDFKPHNYENWKWHFEDSFGVELDTVLKMCLCVTLIVAIIATELWSLVSWFVQIRRLFVICFLISIIWNWFYLYKIAFAEHQNNIVKMDQVISTCTGVKKIDWTDSLKEWFRSSLTLQDDPCKKYYEVLMVNPILLVPPTKAISVTITTFITEPLKHVGQGISEFLRALLKDLPITLQIPVMLTIVLSILVFMYGSVNAAFRYGITAPLRRRRRDPSPPPGLDPPQPHRPRLRDASHYHPGDGDAPPAIRGRAVRAQVRQRRPNRAQEEPARLHVETLGNADRSYGSDELDAGSTESDVDVPQAEAFSETDSESQPDSEETREVAVGANASNVAGIVHSQPSQDKRNSSSSKVEAKTSTDKSSKAKAKTKSPDPKEKAMRNQKTARDSAVEPGHLLQGGQGNESQILEASVAERTSSISMDHIETVGVPVQETSSSS